MDDKQSLDEVCVGDSWLNALGCFGNWYLKMFEAGIKYWKKEENRKERGGLNTQEAPLGALGVVIVRVAIVLSLHTGLLYRHYCIDTPHF